MTSTLTGKTAIITGPSSGLGEATARLLAKGDATSSSPPGEDRRLFYVAWTRARDHLILTSTHAEANRLCGLSLLQSGLELVDISCAPVPFSAEDAQPPELPSPSPTIPSRLLVEPRG